MHFTLRAPDSTLSSVDVKVERRPRDPESIIDPANLPENLVSSLGIITVPLSPEIAKLLPPTRMPQGLVIVALTAGGKGATLDLQVGDVLYAMNGKPLPTLEALRGYLDHLQKNAAIALQWNATASCSTWRLPAPIKGSVSSCPGTICSNIYCSSPAAPLVSDFSATITAHSTSVSMISLVTCSSRPR